MVDTASAFRATIPQIPEAVQRPLWSVMIPAYNCADYLRQTLTSVLMQDPGPEVMQIEVVDDYSMQDDLAAVVAELGGGRVAYYRQPDNKGHIYSFNTCLQRSRGQLVHILHGDDMVREGFYDSMQRAFEVAPDIGAAFCRYISMDDHGHWQTIGPLEQDQSGVVSDWLEKIASGQRLQTPSIVVRRAVYEHLAGFDRRIRYYGEDWEMWIRIAAHYPVWYEVEPLALYRVRAASLTSRSIRTGENMQDLRQVMEIARPYLPAAKADALIATARRSGALAALRRGKRALLAGDLIAPLTQIWQAWKTYPAVDIFIRSSGLIMFWCAFALYRRFAHRNKHTTR